MPRQSEWDGAQIFCARGSGNPKWGIGFSQNQALDACRPNDGEMFDVVRLPANAYQPAVDMMGTLMWKGDCQGEKCKDMGRWKAEWCEGDKDFYYEEVIIKNKEKVNGY